MGFLWLGGVALGLVIGSKYLPRPCRACHERQIREIEAMGAAMRAAVEARNQKGVDRG